MSAEDPRLVRSFLLGRLPTEEREAFEARAFEDDALFDQLQEIEYDLVDAYARGGLLAEDRKAVEDRLLGSPGGRARILVANRLAGREPIQATGSPGHRRLAAPARAWWLTTAAAMALVATGWLAWDNARLRQALRNADAAPSPPAVGRPDASVVADISLAPLVFRGEATTVERRLPPDARLVRLLLAVEEAPGVVRVALERGGVGRVWTQPTVRDRADGSVVVWLPSEVLVPGDYEVVMWREREDPGDLVATYQVRIVP